MASTLRVAQINAGTDYGSLCADEVALITQAIDELRTMGAIGRRLSCRGGFVIELREVEDVMIVAAYEAQSENITVYRYRTENRIDVTRGQDYTSPHFGEVRPLAMNRADYTEYINLRRMLLRFKDAYQDESEERVLAVW